MTDEEGWADLTPPSPEDSWQARVLHRRRSSALGGDRTLDDPSVADLRQDFVSGSADPKMALIDDGGHGMHVAAIIVGGLQRWNLKEEKRHASDVEKRKNNGAIGGADPVPVPRPVAIELPHGVAPLRNWSA